MNNVELFDVNVANRIFDKLSNYYDVNIINEWKQKLQIDITKLFKKYEVEDYKLNKKSYMGIVIECKSKTHGDIIIKVVPPMINRYKTEIGTLKKLPKELVCQIYETDINKNAIIMERIFPGNQVEFDSNKKQIKKLFKILYDNKININKTIDKNFKDFFEVVEHDYNIYKKNNKENNKENSIVDKLYNLFKIKYDEVCYNNTKYLLHGDIYKNNILKSINGLKVIDPLGFKAPFVMELVSICAYDIFYSKKDFDYNLVVDKYINLFKEFTDCNIYKKALFCQLVKVYIPSIYEANDGGIRAQKWLEIINKLYYDEIQ